MPSAAAPGRRPRPLKFLSKSSMKFLTKRHIAGMIGRWRGVEIGRRGAVADGVEHAHTGRLD